MNIGEMKPEHQIKINVQDTQVWHLPSLINDFKREYIFRSNSTMRVKIVNDRGAPIAWVEPGKEVTLRPRVVSIEARTGKDKCEWTLEILAKHHVETQFKTADELWNYSSTGELSFVSELYDMALALEGFERSINPENGNITWYQWEIVADKELEANE